MSGVSGPRGREGRSPTVCVIIPAYGVNAYIAEAVDSVLAQTYADCEAVVVDDGCPPAEAAELRAILARYAGRPVRYLRRENGGQAAARNTAMAATAAPYVAFLDGDDYWAPRLLERQMALLAADPGLALVYADAWLFGEGPAVGRTYMQSGADSRGPVTLEALLTCDVNVTMSTIVARRDAVLAAGGFDEALRYVEDYELWLRMAHAGARMKYVREPLAYRRIRVTSLSADSLKLETALVSVLERFGRTHELAPPAVAARREALGRARSLLAVTSAKASLAERRPEDAAAALRLVRAEDANWKLRVARVMLGAMPGLGTLLFRGWTSLLESRNRRASARAAELGALIPGAMPSASTPGGVE